MTEAINIDGGGSTTYYVREPGEASPNLLNKPSDLHERPVGNSLLVVSQTTATDQLSGINLFPSESIHRVVVGSDLRLRSEEHTSELQSRGHLVCRLLLEKKNRGERGHKRVYTTLH